MTKVTLIGFGNIGKKYFQQSLNMNNIAIEKIIKRKKRSNLKGVEFFTRFNLIDSKSCDAYIIASRVNTHFYYIKKIVKQKKPFILEKPIVENQHQLSKLQKLCKNYKYPILVNHSDLYNPAFLKFEKTIKTIGKFQEINISFGKLQKIKLIKTNDKKNYNYLPSFDWLPHPIAIAIRLAGMPNKIRIIENKLNTKKGFISQSSKILFFTKNRTININFSNNYSNPKRQVLIRGSKSTLVYDAYKKNMLIKKNIKGKIRQINYKKIKPIRNLLDIFYSNIKSKKKVNDLNFSYKVMRVLFEIDKKIKLMHSLKNNEAIIDFL